STLGQAERAAEGEGRALGEAVYGISQTPQVWLDHQVYERAGALLYNWDAVEELFPPGLLDAMFETYGRGMDELQEEAAGQRETRPWVPAEQLSRRARVNATAAPVPAGLLQEPFELRAAAEPEQVAVIAGERRMSYRELDLRANGLALELRRRGVAPGRL